MTEKIIKVVFYRTLSGTEPVREWVKSLAEADKKILGKAILKIEEGWPIGMPLCDYLNNGIW